MKRTRAEVHAREAARRAKAAAARPPQPERRPFSAKRPGERIEEALQPALCVNEPELVEQAAQDSHDMLIRTWGRARRSGVRWRILTGRSEAETTLTKVWRETAGAPEVLAGYLAWLHGLPADTDVALVIAMCEVAR